MGQSTSVGPLELQSAFQTFNQLSEQLITSYASLQERVAELGRELVDTREEKMFELAEKERLANRLTSILNALPAAVVVLDSLGSIQEVNPPAIEMFGEQLLGEKWIDIIEQSFSPRSDDGHDISLKNGRRVNITTNPLDSESGQILLIKDVTQSRNLTEQLNRYQKLTAMGEMASGLAHQIRTPLATSMLYASHLKQSQLSTEKRYEVVDKIQIQMRHIENLVNDMLTFARGDMAGNQPVSIHMLLDDLEKMIQPEIEAEDIKLSVNNEIQEKDSVMIGSKEVLLSALQNIVSNAVQSMSGAEKNKHQIDITMRPAITGTVDFIVSDNGKGISKEKQERILEPFFTTRSQGTGLGLAVVDAIAKGHNGCLWFNSVEGIGSTFALRLPIVTDKKITS